jgi:ATP-binding cassette subfamily F protein uup
MAVAKASATAAATTPVAAALPADAAPKRKLSYKDARELEQLPALIETLEQQVAALTEAMNDPAFYQRDSAAMTAHTAALGDAQARLDAAFARWSELDS